MCPTPSLLSGIVYNITGNGSLTLAEVNAISEVVTSLADPSCNIIFGAVIDPECPPDEIRGAQGCVCGRQAGHVLCAVCSPPASSRECLVVCSTVV